MNEVEARTLHVKAGMQYVSHPYPDPRQPFATGRTHFLECVTPRPEPICRCGIAFIVWEVAPR